MSTDSPPLVNRFQIGFRSFSRPAPNGFTLVEVMTALAISLFLLLGVTYVYTGSKQTYRSNASLSRMQENGRLAIEYLTQDLQMAGNFGCATGIINTNYGKCATSPANKLNNLLATPDGSFAHDFRHPIEGYDGEKAVTNASPGTDSDDFDPDLATTGAPTTALANSDVVIVRGARPLGKTVTAQASGTADIVISATHNLAANDVTLVADCQSAGVFTATSITTTSTTTTISHAQASGKNACADLGKPYVGGEVLKAFSRAYYIATDPATGLRALYRREVGGTDQLLVPGVENMQLKYGLAGNMEGYPTDYLTAGDVQGEICNDKAIGGTSTGDPWDCVKSVRIELLLVSAEDRLTTAAQTVWFDGSDFTPADSRLRLVMTATIGVRNRLLQSQK